jgi:hypothetical protein
MRAAKGLVRTRETGARGSRAAPQSGDASRSAIGRAILSRRLIAASREPVPAARAYEPSRARPPRDAT